MQPRRPSSRSLWLALCWGLAEATMFFIVPDVLLTWIALKNRTRALYCCLAASGGALIGGCIMYQWGAADYETALRVLDIVPAISRDMIESVQDSISEQGSWAMFIGPLTGTPYKIFAIEAGNSGQQLWLFLLLSIPTRLPRFVILSLIAAGVSSILSRWLKLHHLRLIHLACWGVFYCIYFWMMPN